MHAPQVVRRFQITYLLARTVFTAALFIGCSAEEVMATSFSGSNGGSSCPSDGWDENWVRNFPRSDGRSCAYVTYTFTPQYDGQMPVSITPTGGYSWGRQGFLDGIPGMFAILGPSSSPQDWTRNGNVYFDAAAVTHTIPVVANQTYYLHVGYGTWANPPFIPLTGTFTVNYTLPPAPQPPQAIEDTSVPLPLWALFALGGGLFMVYRKVHRDGNRQ